MAGGGWWIGDLIGIGGAYYTSQKIFGDPDQGGTLLLAPGQGPINVLGKAYVRARVLDNDFRGDRQLVDTPLMTTPCYLRPLIVKFEVR
jgi:hypothetical protein